MLEAALIELGRVAGGGPDAPPLLGGESGGGGGDQHGQQGGRGQRASGTAQHARLRLVWCGECIAGPSPVRDPNHDSMATLDELFTDLTNAVREGAQPRGFEEVPDRGPAGAFGARIARWRRGAEELVLLWDAREQWINFEFRTTADQSPALEWTARFPTAIPAPTSAMATGSSSGET